MTLVPIKCPGLLSSGQPCTNVLAQTDGQRLYIETTRLEWTVTLHCARPGCSGRRVWAPGRATRSDPKPGLDGTAFEATRAGR